MGYPLVGQGPSWDTLHHILTSRRVPTRSFDLFVASIMATHDDVDAALNEYRNGLYLILRQAAAAWDVSKPTLAHRNKGCQNRYSINQDQQKLLSSEEKVLVNHVRDQTQAGYPPSVSAVRMMANILLERRLSLGRGVDSAQIVWIHWFKKFAARHPDLKAIKIRSMETMRVKESSPACLGEWFEIAKEHLPGTPVYNIYNMDETGIMLGYLKTAKRVVTTDVPRPYQASPFTRESATILECISASGRAITPTIILKAKTHRNNWYPQGTTGPSTWNYATSLNGYTNNELGLFWLEKVFEPQTAPLANGQRRVLVSNRHGSHETADFLTFCFAHNIMLLRLPAHTSHLTQPLDVGCFSHIRREYREQVEWLCQGGADRIQETDVHRHL